MKTTNSVTKETLESLYSILSHLHLEISKDPKEHDNIWTLVRTMIDSIVPEVS